MHLNINPILHIENKNALVNFSAGKYFKLLELTES